MEVFSYPCTISRPTAVALGRFDGVHTAHRKVICAAAKEKGLSPAVFTFCDNPGKTSHALLSTEEEKQTLISACGIEILVNATFASVKDMSAEEFVRDVLCKNLGAKSIFCGYNYRFGKGAQADVTTLSTLCEKYGLTLTCVEELSNEDCTVSSTAIRNALFEGDIPTATKLLGRHYTLSGNIIHGNAVGRTIETPTLNLDVDKDKLLPAFGVYATLAHIGSKTYKSVTNIGLKPTVGADSPTVETFLLDASGDFYTENCIIELVAYLRKEEKFADLDALKAQIAKDIEKTKEILA